jgi:hypothetical protein
MVLTYTPAKGIEALRSLPEAQQWEVVWGLDKNERTKLMAKLKCASSQFGTPSTASVIDNLAKDEP